MKHHSSWVSSKYKLCLWRVALLNSLTLLQKLCGLILRMVILLDVGCLEVLLELNAAYEIQGLQYGGWIDCGIKWWGSIVVWWCHITYGRCLIKTAVPVKISQYSFHVFLCVYPTVISSISGRSFHFPFPYFVIFVLWYFPFHVVYMVNIYY